jgi:hypothetical protein
VTTHAEGRLIGDPMLQSVPGFRGRRRTPIREEADVLIVTIADFRSTPRIRAGHAASQIGVSIGLGNLV